MKILHIVPGLDEYSSGIAVAAKLIACGQRENGDAVDVLDCSNRLRDLASYDEAWVHSMWMPQVWKACFRVLSARKQNAAPKLVRMTHANLDPVRYRFHGWKKRLVSPVERIIFARTDRIVVTCEAERDWCRMWGLANEFQLLDMKQYFSVGEHHENQCETRHARNDSLNVLYLGRRHPLKGVGFLEQAVDEINHSGGKTCSLRIVSDHAGTELEADWEWCDVLCLPTLSENFALVVAEALERGKRVITTDGAPAWEDIKPSQGIYLKGFRSGTTDERVRLLKDALATCQ